MNKCIHQPHCVCVVLVEGQGKVCLFELKD